MTMNEPIPSASPAAPSSLLAALSNQYNLILLAGSAAFSAALASWAPLLSGLAAEAVWLLTGPRLFAARHPTGALAPSALDTFADSPAAQVPAEYADHAATVESTLRQVEELCAARSDLTVSDRAELRRRLATLVPSFANACATHQRLRRAALQVPLAELQTEVTSLERALASETELGIRASLRRGLVVAERRIKQLEGNEATCRTIELGLRNFLQALALVAETAAGWATLAELGAEIDSAAAQLEGHTVAEVGRELSTTRAIVPPPLPRSD